MKALPSIVAFAAALSLGHAAPKTLPPLPVSKPGSQVVLLGTDSVRKELHLTSLQRAVLNDIRSEYRDEARAIVAKAGPDAASKKQAQARLDALTASTNRRALRALNDGQRARLTQIEHRILGAFMLLDAKIQRELALTPQQKAKLAHVWWHTQKSVNEINASYEKGEISYYERIIELRDNRIDRSDDMLERLTPEQRAKLTALEGEKFAS